MKKIYSAEIYLSKSVLINKIINIKVVLSSLHSLKIYSESTIHIKCSDSSSSKTKVLQGSFEDESAVMRNPAEKHSAEAYKRWRNHCSIELSL